MYHFNSTLKNGDVVNTKRGFYVVRQKHQGLGFVNSSSLNQGTQIWTKPSKPLPPSMKFVAQKNVSGDKRRKSRSRTSKESDEKKKESRRGSTAKSPLRRVVAGQSHDGAPVEQPESIAIRQPHWFPEAGLKDRPDESRDSEEFPSWVSCAFPNGPSEKAKKIAEAFQVLSTVPAWDSAMNPVGSQQQNSLNPLDSLSTACSHLMKALFQLLEGGNRNVGDLSSHYAGLCSLVSQLLNATGQTDDQEMVKIMAVSKLAILANFLGRHDDWVIHMAGLRYVIEAYGGQEKLSPFISLLVKKADLLASSETFAKPVFPFVRLQTPFSLILSPEERAGTQYTVYQALLGAGISVCTIESLGYLANFINAIDLGMSRPGYIEQDPVALIEDYYFIEHEFLSYPGPIQTRQLNSYPSSIRETSVNPSEDGSVDSTTFSIDSETPVDLFTSLEAAVRITALLYLKMLNPPAPDSISGFTNVLELLTFHMRNILVWLQTSPASLTIDPLLINDNVHMRLTREAMRPVLIWICLAADHMARIHSLTGCRLEGQVPEWFLVHRQLLAEVVGASPHDVNLVTQGDLEMCRLFDFGTLLGQPWDECAKMKQILAVH